MSARANAELEISDPVLREIAQELYRKFSLISNNISIHIDSHGIVVYVHADRGKLVLPRGPRDVRVHDGHEILQPPEF